MSEETYYIKRDGKFVPVSFYDSRVLDGIPHGAHLLVKQPGCSMRRYNVEIARAPMIAAALYSQNKIVDFAIDSITGQPGNQPLTQEQKEAWNALNRAFGGNVFLTRPSVSEILSRLTECLAKEAEQQLENPVVRKAWDRFLLVSRLTSEKEC